MEWKVSSRPEPQKLSGFSMIELSAVLVIISAIIALIVFGSTLTQQATLRSVISDMQSYRDMFQSFNTIYKQYPGDMANAASIWSVAGTCSNGPTCNGNGNGVINVTWNSVNDETLRAWLHLYLAGLNPNGTIPIPAGYVGVLTLGNMAPRSKVDGAGYYIGAGSRIGGDAVATVFPSPWTDNVTNGVFLGKKSSSATSNGLTIGAMTGDDAFAIDRKIDDGIITAGVATGATTGKFRAVNDTTGTNQCISGANYVSGSKQTNCVVGYQLHDKNF